MTTPAQTVQSWIDRLSAENRQWISTTTKRLFEIYRKSPIKPITQALILEKELARLPTRIFHQRRKFGTVTREQHEVSCLIVEISGSAWFTGTLVGYHSIALERKSAVVGSHHAFCYVQQHALERLVERAGATEADLIDAHRQLAMVAQAFNSAHLFGHDPKMPLMLPFGDGLFLGQSESLGDIPSGTHLTFDRNGVVPRTMAQPKIAVLLGNPPRAMLIRTFVGGDEGLTRRKGEAHGMLTDFFARHHGLLESFSRRALFDFDFDDLTHAIWVDFQKIAAQFMGEVDRIEGRPVEEPPPTDPLESMFRAEADRTAFRSMLDEYRQLLDTPSVKAVIEASRKHVR